VTCRELTGFLLEYVAGDLPADLRTAFDAHLAACANCREFLAQYRATVVATARAWSGEPAGAPADLVDAILKIVGR
jgi:anti-sigma factor RsiW